MSRLENLIEELCPKGVKFSSLSSVAQISIGTKPSESENEKLAPHPYINGGVKPSGYVLETNTEPETITIPSRGSVGVVGFQKKAFWCGPLSYRIRAKSRNEISTAFLYYALKSIELKIVALQQSASIPALNKAQLEKVQVPVPPLEVQQEIVRILDTFTELETELEAELESRKNQYEYYRYKLLSTELPASVEFKTLGELLGPIPRGKRLTKANLAEVGSIPVFHGGLNPIGYHDESNTVGETVMVINTGASSGRVGWSSSPFWCSDGCFALPHSEFISSRFLFHFACLNEKYFTEKVRKAGIPTLAAESILSLPIPVLPKSKQLEIAETLDAFFELTANLSIGLPAEIEPRRRQYAYYRDKLLTFKELAA